MLQFGLLTLAVICGTTNAAYSSSSGAGAGAGSFAGSFGQGGGGGVYGNTVHNSGNYGNKYPYPNNGAFYGTTTGTYNQAGGAFPQQQFPFAQPPQFAAPAQYNQFVQDFWKQFGQNFQNLYNQQLAHQSALFSQFGAGAAGAGAGGFGSAYGGNFGAGNGAGYGGAGYGGVPNGFYAPNFAGSSASYGPHGVHQTASIIPANPNSPNVDTRFDDKPIVTVSAGPGGFHGVSTSSFSSSSDINGQKTNHREASTSVNDNGKVTTYTVRS